MCPKSTASQSEVMRGDCHVRGLLPSVRGTAVRATAACHCVRSHWVLRRAVSDMPSGLLEEGYGAAVAASSSAGRGVAAACGRSLSKLQDAGCGALGHVMCWAGWLCAVAVVVTGCGWLGVGQGLPSCACSPWGRGHGSVRQQAVAGLTIGSIAGRQCGLAHRTRRVCAALLFGWHPVGKHRSYLCVSASDRDLHTEPRHWRLSRRQKKELYVSLATVQAHTRHFAWRVL
jgi:hypothetical protein